jgi:transketolase
MEALAADGLPKIAHLGVKGLPTSGKPDELMNAAGISAKQIVAAATKLLAAK